MGVEVHNRRSPSGQHVEHVPGVTAMAPGCPNQCAPPHSQMCSTQILPGKPSGLPSWTRCPRARRVNLHRVHVASSSSVWNLIRGRNCAGTCGEHAPSIAPIRQALRRVIHAPLEATGMTERASASSQPCRFRYKRNCRRRPKIGSLSRGLECDVRRCLRLS